MNQPALRIYFTLIHLIFCWIDSTQEMEPSLSCMKNRTNFTFIIILHRCFSVHSIWTMWFTYCNIHFEIVSASQQGCSTNCIRVKWLSSLNGFLVFWNWNLLANFFCFLRKTPALVWLPKFGWRGLINGWVKIQEYPGLFSRGNFALHNSVPVIFVSQSTLVFVITFKKRTFLTSRRFPSFGEESSLFSRLCRANRVNEQLVSFSD